MGKIDRDEKDARKIFCINGNSEMRIFFSLYFNLYFSIF